MNSIFKQKLREELDFQDIRVKELAEKTQIPQRTIEGYLSTRTSIPPADIAVKIAKVLNVTVEYLVTGEDLHIEKRPILDERAILREISKLSDESRELFLEAAQTIIKFDSRKK